MTYVSDRLIRGGVDFWTTGETEEQNSTLPISTSSATATHKVIYTLEIPDIRAGDLLEVNVYGQLGNPQTYTVGFTSYAILADTATGVGVCNQTAGQEHIVITDHKGANVDDATNYLLQDVSGSYVAKRNLGTRYVNFIAYAYSTSATGETATVARSGGRMEVRRTRAVGVLASGSLKDWTPGDLGNLRGWYRADKIEGVADGATVTNWLSVNNLSSMFTQASASLRPTLYTTTGAQLVGGQPALKFDGSADVLRAADGAEWEVDSEGAVIIVARGNSAASGSLVSAGLTTTGGDVNFVRAILISDGSFELEQREDDTEDSWLTGASEWTVSTDHVFEISSSGTAYEIRIDGSVVSASSNSGTDSGDWFADTSINVTAIGAAVRATGTVLYADASIAEVIFLHSQMDATDRILFHRYIESRYGITMGS